MLSFFSSSTRIVNTNRAVSECLEIALGDDYSNVDLLLFHASIGHNFIQLIIKAKELAPNAQILACSCCGVVGREGVSESMKDIALMAVKGKEFATSSINNIYGSNSYEKALEMAKALKAKNAGVNMIYLLASGIDIDNNACISAIEEVFGPDVTIFGATSSDNMKGIVSYQALNDSVLEHGAFLIGFADKTLKIETQATHGFVAIGEPMVVTKAHGHIIKELDGKPAWPEYIKRLGLDENATCADSIPIGALGEKLTPEMATEYGNQHILRAVTKHDGNDIYYATACTEGTQLWLTTRDEDLIFSEMENMINSLCKRIDNKEVIAVFHADCLARGRSLFNKIIKDELVSKMQFPFLKNNTCPPWLGMYGFGEFGRLADKNTYHNYTTALYILYR